MFIIGGCSQSSFINHTISFDRAFIPALYFTGKGEVEASISALKQLRKEWENFSLTYYGLMPRDREWKEDLSEIDRNISSAIQLACIGKDLSAAYSKMEKVRGLFWQMRKRNNIRYFLDHINEFGELAEAMLLIVDDKKADKLSVSDMRNLKWLSDRALVIWNKMARSEFNSSLYGFNQDKTKLMRQYIEAENRILAKINKTITDGDKSALISSIEDIKPNYSALYFLFGDFEAVKK